MSLSLVRSFGVRIAIFERVVGAGRCQERKARMVRCGLAKLGARLFLGLAAASRLIISSSSLVPSAPPVLQLYHCADYLVAAKAVYCFRIPKSHPLSPYIALYRLLRYRAHIVSAARSVDPPETCTSFREIILSDLRLAILRVPDCKPPWLSHVSILDRLR